MVKKVSKSFPCKEVSPPSHCPMQLNETFQMLIITFYVMLFISLQKEDVIAEFLEQQQAEASERADEKAAEAEQAKIRVREIGNALTNK